MTRWLKYWWMLANLYQWRPPAGVAHVLCISPATREIRVGLILTEADSTGEAREIDTRVPVRRVLNALDREADDMLRQRDAVRLVLDTSGAGRDQ